MDSRGKAPYHEREQIDKALIFMRIAWFSANRRLFCRKRSAKRAVSSISAAFCAAKLDFLIPLRRIIRRTTPYTEENT